MKERVEPLAQAERRPVALKVDMRDLAQRVDAGVRPPRAVGGRVFARHGEEGALERLLDREAVLLPLPADERRAVIFEDQLKARHSASLRAGAARGKVRRALSLLEPSAFGFTRILRS